MESMFIKYRRSGYYTMFFLLMSACVTIPQETITLSKTLGSDLTILHNSHRNMVQIYYGKVEDDINSFIDDVYAPFVIHYVLSKDMSNYKADKESLFGFIEKAANSAEKEVTEQALDRMFKFQDAAYKQIDKKRKELLQPIHKQRNQILMTIDQSYENAIYANSTITGYLESVQKVKSAQQEALSLVGLEGADSVVTQTLIQMSEKVNEAVRAGKEIDVKSDEAYQKIEAITKKLKDLTK